MDELTGGDNGRTNIIVREGGRDNIHINCCSSGNGSIIRGTHCVGYWPGNFQRS